MTTFLQQLADDLEKNCMFPDQIQAVLALFVEGEKSSAMASRWHEHVGDYPEMMYSVLWRTCRHYALIYIDEHCPQAWFRPMFDMTDPIHQQVKESVCHELTSTTSSVHQSTDSKNLKTQPSTIK